jgi:hypothetical protein
MIHLFVLVFIGLFGFVLSLIGEEYPQMDACAPKLIGSIHRCDEKGCDVLLVDGTKGKTTKWPVEFAMVHPEVCQ